MTGPTTTTTATPADNSNPSGMRHLQPQQQQQRQQQQQQQQQLRPLPHLPPLPPLPPLLQLSWACVAAAAVAAVLLWGVGAEAAWFGHRLSGVFLLADAVIVSCLEALTAADLLRATAATCPAISTAVDTYRRAVVYALLTVPCFVRLNHYWLPALPGCALILSVVLYAMKHFCSRTSPYDFGKMPSFVSFEDDCYISPEMQPHSQATCWIDDHSASCSAELGAADVRDTTAARSPPSPPPRPPPPPPPPRRKAKLPLFTSDKRRLFDEDDYDRDDDEDQV